MREVLTFDIGGTFIKWAVINEDCKMLENGKFATPDSYSELISSIKIRRESFKKIDGVSLSIPAGYDHVNDKAFAPNLTVLNGNAVKRDLLKNLDADVMVENDGNLATLGEYHLIEKAKIDNMILLTLGTGVGGGAIVNGKLLSSFATAFEVGHIMAKKGGRACGCGRLGCLDEYATIIGLRTTYAEITGIKNKEPMEISTLYDNGDRFAIETFNRYADMLGSAITDLANLFAPEKIKIGGGLSELHRCYFPRLLESFNSTVFPLYRGRVSLEVAGLKNNAGLFGAAMNYFLKG